MTQQMFGCEHSLRVVRVVVVASCFLSLGVAVHPSTSSFGFRPTDSITWLNEESPLL